MKKSRYLEELLEYKTNEISDLRSRLSKFEDSWKGSTVLTPDPNVPSNKIFAFPKDYLPEFNQLIEIEGVHYCVTSVDRVNESFTVKKYRNPRS